MANYIQYSSTYSLPSSSLVNYAVGKIQLFDNYTFCRTGEREYILFVDKPFGDDFVYRFYSSQSMGQAYNISKSVDNNFNLIVSQPLYCYSNIQDGVPINRQSYLTDIISISVFICALGLLFNFIFGRINKWLKTVLSKKRQKSLSA